MIKNLKSNKKDLKKCYKCYQNKPNCQLVSWNQETLAYTLGEQTYICKECDYFLQVGQIMREQGVEIDDCY